MSIAVFTPTRPGTVLRRPGPASDGQGSPGRRRPDGPPPDLGPGRPRRPRRTPETLASAAGRWALAAALVAGAVLGLAATGPGETAAAVAQAGSELTRLLRFMALLKATMALGALAAVSWRLGVAVRPAWLAAYLLAGAGMAAGPGLIWGMAHVGLGALLLHGGLFGAIVLLWRDPAVSARLGAALDARRDALAERR